MTECLKSLCFAAFLVNAVNQVIHLQENGLERGMM